MDNLAVPQRTTRLPKVTPARIEPLATETVQRMQEAVPPVPVSAKANLGLTADRLDFLRRTLRVDRQLSVVAGEAPRLTPPKTSASVRTVPLPAVVVAGCPQPAGLGHMPRLEALFTPRC